MKQVGLVSIVVLLLAAPVRGADPICPGFLRSVPVNGPTAITGVDAAGDLAVTADSYGLSTWDLSDPTQPTRLGSYAYGRGSFPDPNDFVLDVYLHPSKTWACLIPTFDCFDLRDPAHPQPYRWQTDDWPVLNDPAASYNDSAGTAINGKLVAARHAGDHPPIYRDVWLLDVAPASRGEWLKPEALANRFAIVKDVAFAEDHLLVFDVVYREFVVFDVHKPKHPIEVASIRVDGIWSGTQRLKIAAGDNVAIVVQHNGYSETARQMIDLRDPSRPVAVPNGNALTGNIFDVDFFGDTAIAVLSDYVDGERKTFVEEVDFSDPSAPSVIARFEISAIASSKVAGGGEIAIVAQWHQLTIHDRRTGLGPIGHTPIEGSADCLRVDRALGVLANGAGGIVTYDLGDPSNPIEIGRFDLGSFSNVKLDDRLAVAVSTASDELVTIDVENPRAPVVLGSIEIDGLENEIAIGDDTVAVSSYRDEAPLHLIDLSDPTDLTLLASFAPLVDCCAYIKDVSIDGTSLFVAAEGGLASNYLNHFMSVDITDPFSPSVMSTIELPTFRWGAFGFGIVGQSAVLGDSVAGTTVIDVSDPGNLQVSHVHEDLRASVVSNLDERMLAVAGEGRVVADFSDPGNPVTYDEPTISREYEAGVIVGDVWLRPSGPVIDVVSLECRPPEAEIRWAGRGPTIWFEDLSRYQVTDRLWDFGDGETSDELNPVHTFPGPGDYTVTLTVSSPNGADSVAHVVAVGPTPVRHQPPGSRRP